MKRIYLVLLLFSCGISNTFAQLTTPPGNIRIIDDKHKMQFQPPSGKRSLQSPTQCGVDTVEYPYYKSTRLVTISVNRGRGLGQLYSCPKPLVLTGFNFYAFVISNPPTAKKMNLICNVYRAGADSLPTGAPLRSDTVMIDSTIGGGLLSRIIKRANFDPITLDSNFILTIETDSANMTAAVVTNDYAQGNGRRENLNCGSISGLWYNGRNLNVQGIPFDCDVLINPYVQYKFGTDFTIKNNCYNLNDSVRFINAAPSNMAGSKMYNWYNVYNIGMYCHLWETENMGYSYGVDQTVLYNDHQNYKVTLISTVYQYNGPTFGCVDTTVKTIYFKPDVPTFSGLTNLCSGDTAKFTAMSNDTGIVYEWLKRPNLPPFFTGQVYKKFPLTKDDTVYLRANNHGCVSGVRTIIFRVNAYPSSLVIRHDSVCAGSKANLKATSNIGTILWYTSPSGGLPFYSGSVYQTKILTDDTTFYVQAGNNGCLLNPRQAVSAFVGANFAPAPPAVSPDTVVCLSSGGVVTMRATAPGGLTIRWFDASSGGTAINTGNTLNFMPVKREVRTFYADAFNGVCGSTRVPINVTVEDHPAISMVLNDTICVGDSAYLSLVIPYGQADWYDAPTGGNNVFSGTYLAGMPSASTSYYIETSSGICRNPLRTNISVLVNSAPAVVKLWGDTICSKNQATLKSVLAGPGIIQWFESDTSNQALGSGNIFKTPVLNFGKKYFAQTSYAGCVGIKLPVQPTVKASPFSGFSFEVMTWQRVKVSPINSAGSTIKWDFGDGTTRTDSIVTHRYQNTGTYPVKLILTSKSTGCKDSTTVNLEIETSSIRENRLPGAKVYPNPAALVLNVSSGVLGENDPVVTIYSSAGQLVSTGKIKAVAGVLSVPVSALPSGVYLVKVEGFEAITFIKE